MSKQLLVTVIFFLGGVLAVGAQSSPVGIWKTVDDASGEAKSHVEIYRQGDALYGNIVKLLKSDPASLCDECKGDTKDQPVLGRIIIENLEAYKDYWRKGTILDPESGNEYSCSIWFENGSADELQVRGKHWTGLYRTQTWYRVK